MVCSTVSGASYPGQPGKHTAGIDGAKTLTPPQRWRLANELHLDGTATALRRIWIPKRGSTTESAHWAFRPKRTGHGKR